MLLYAYLAVSVVLTIACMPTATKLSRQAGPSSSWSHVLLVAALWVTTAAPGTYVYGLSHATGSWVHWILGWVFGLLAALVFFLTLFSVVGVEKKIVCMPQNGL